MMAVLRRHHFGDCEMQVTVEEYPVEIDGVTIRLRVTTRAITLTPPPDHGAFLAEDAEEEQTPAPPRRPFGGSPYTGDITAFDAIGEDLNGLTFVIEYLGAKGGASVRRVTLRQIYYDGGRVIMMAYCHTRRMARTFRFDRIKSIIDFDGEVHDPVKYFAALGLDLPSAAALPTTPARPGPVNARPGVAQLAAARPGMLLLAALSRADGLMHTDEVAEIVDYVVKRAALQGVASNDDDCIAISARVRRQYPAAEELCGCINAVRAEPAEMQRLFLRAAVKVMDADGEQHPAEFDALLRMEQGILR